ncbi:hypothetical protein PIROE2DRAFT_22490, partial [Piromyces sp. E2]
VPILVQKCVELVEKIGLRTEGIYRLSGNSATIQSLRKNSIESPNNLYDNDVHVVTGCLKSYLRDGIGDERQPVCTYDLYNEFIHASQIKEYRERMIKFQDIVHMLPKLHFVTLRFICEHLFRVSLYSTVNKMTVKNLAIVFGPTLLK